jgi:hypothetical protein
MAAATRSLATALWGARFASGLLRPQLPGHDRWKTRWTGARGFEPPTSAVQASAR